jgi:hypothetical protein
MPVKAVEAASIQTKEINYAFPANRPFASLQAGFQRKRKKSMWSDLGGSPSATAAANCAISPMLRDAASHHA